jgi:hypothetical protein
MPQQLEELLTTRSSRRMLVDGFRVAWDTFIRDAEIRNGDTKK